MDFEVSKSTREFREEVRAFAAEWVTADMLDRIRRTGTVHDWDFHRALASRGWIAPGWPRDIGGQGRDAFAVAAFFEELFISGAPMDGHGTTMLVASVLRRLGTDSQREELLPRILAGDVLIALGFSEPDAGSDVAATSTRAVRDGDSWVINGQKMFTTLAHEAQFVFLLARTGDPAMKHRSLTTFLVSLEDPGVEIRPVHTLGGERTNVTFYDDVRVSDSWRIGDVHGGWDVMNVALTYERAGGYGPFLEKLYREAVDAFAGEHGGVRLLGEPTVRSRLARIAIDSEVSRLIEAKTAWMESCGKVPATEASMVKLFTAERYVSAADALLSIAGAEGQLAHGVPLNVADGSLEHTYRHAIVTTIYGGTSELQRGIIARQHLGLPRSS